MSEVITKRTIHPTRMHLAEYDRQDWTVNADLGTKLEEVLEPDYWAHMAPQMQQYDHIEVRVDDGSWIAYLLVTACDRNWAKVKLLHRYDLVEDQSIPVASLRYKVDFKGPQHRWSVIRLSDGAYVHEGERTRLAAEQWMANHEKTV